MPVNGARRAISTERAQIRDAPAALQRILGLDRGRAGGSRFSVEHRHFAEEVALAQERQVLPAPLHVAEGLQAHVDARVLGHHRAELPDQAPSGGRAGSTRG